MHDRQTETERAPSIPGAADKALEQGWRELRRHTRAVVLDDQLGLTIHQARADPDLTPRGSVAQGVLDQVDRQSVQLIARPLDRGRPNVQLDVMRIADGPQLACGLDYDLV